MDLIENVVLYDGMVVSVPISICPFSFFVYHNPVLQDIPDILFPGKTEPLLCWIFRDILCPQEEYKLSSSIHNKSQYQHQHHYL